MGINLNNAEQLLGLKTAPDFLASRGFCISMRILNRYSHLTTLPHAC